MSALAEGESGMMSCASCGITENHGVKLKKCTACYLVKYCSIKCQKEHRPKHKRACKKRAAEIRDELLFKQPESSHKGDCPICMIPMSLDVDTATMMACCSKTICRGCYYGNMGRELEASQVSSCPFCREPTPKREECDKLRMKRIKLNDPVAIRQEGVGKHRKGDYSGAVEYYSKAAQLGDVEAHYHLACLYNKGLGVERDAEKTMHHLEEASIGGHPGARHGLGCEEWENGNFERAAGHWVIAVKQGYDDSTKELMNAYQEGFVSKEGLAAALRAHHAAVDASKSRSREVAEKAEELCSQLGLEGVSLSPPSPQP